MKKEFIKYLQNNGVALNPRVAEAFNAINRKDFMLEGESEMDMPFPIAGGQTISQPYTVAFMLDKLDIKEGMKVLDVGSGSGWTTALIAHIIGKRGYVVGVELLDELVKFGSKNLKKYNFKNAEIIKAKKDIKGLPEKAPYDRILVSAAATTVPEILIDQLSKEGIMLIPVNNTIQRITKKSREIWHGFSFVPLK
ncbi:MAG: protein-L-isoaspartate O-methyltransferase [Candidatus Woesearchaeota archaeon]